MKFQKTLSVAQIISMILGIIILCIFVALLPAFVVYLVWANILTVVFGVPALTFWQTFFIMVALSFIGQMFKTSISVNNKD